MSINNNSGGKNMTEKEIRENIAHESKAYDEEIESMKSEIDKMLKNLNELSPEEKVIIEKIQKVLEEHNLKYSYDEDEPKYIGLGFSIENKPFKIHIIMQNGKVIFRLSFPFRVQTNAYPLMCMFITEFNENKAFSLLNLDPDDGELTMEYSYMLEDPDHFDEKYFWIYMTSLIHPALEIYTKATHLSAGIVSRKDRKFYKKLLEMALETVNGEFDYGNTSYGTESLKSDLLPDLSDLFGKDDGNEGKEDGSESDDKDTTSDIMRSLRRGRRVPNFEEFMRMKMQAENEEEEIENQPV